MRNVSCASSDFLRVLDRKRRHKYRAGGLRNSASNWPADLQGIGCSLKSGFSFSILKYGGLYSSASGATLSNISRIGPSMTSRVDLTSDVRGEESQVTSHSTRTA
jgi:hypothetical protein